MTKPTNHQWIWQRLTSVTFALEATGWGIIIVVLRAFVARSLPVPIPKGVNAVQMHRITWPQMGPFIRREVTALLDAGSGPSRSPSLLIQESSISYRTVDLRKPEQRHAA